MCDRTLITTLYLLYQKLNYLKNFNNSFTEKVFTMFAFSAQPRRAMAMPYSIKPNCSFWWLCGFIIIFIPSAFALLIYISRKSNLSGEELISKIVPVCLATFNILSKSI